MKTKVRASEEAMSQRGKHETARKARVNEEGTNQQGMHQSTKKARDHVRARLTSATTYEVIHSIGVVISFTARCMGVRPGWLLGTHFKFGIFGEP